MGLGFNLQVHPAPVIGLFSESKILSLAWCSGFELVDLQGWVRPAPPLFKSNNRNLGNFIILNPNYLIVIFKNNSALLPMQCLL